MIDDQPKQPYQPLACPQCHVPTQTTRPFCERCKFDLRYGTSKLLASGQCIYCQKRSRFSDEHVFPRWLRSCFPRRHKKTEHYLSRPEKLVFGEDSPIHGQIYSRFGDPYTTVVRNVCADCNNGWMSTLQNQAKPLVQRLAEGQRLEIDDLQSVILARWGAMVTINLECLARMLSTTQFQRTTLMNGDMPPGWHMSIARMVETDCAGRSFHRAIVVPIGIGSEGDHLRVGSTFFVIERAAFHTMNALGDQTLQLGLTMVGVSESQFPTLTVWPRNSANFLKNLPDLVGHDLDNIQRHFGHPG